MKIKSIILTTITTISLSSCVDLNYTEVTGNDEEWIYKNPVYGIQNLVTSIYAHIPNGFDRNYQGTDGATLAAATDEADCAISGDGIQQFYNGNWSPINPIDYTWTNAYQAIAEANNFLEKLDYIDLTDYQHNSDYEAMKNKFELFQYEARYLRAWFYFELVRAYGDIPFTLKTLTNHEANTITRTPAITIIDWITHEMDNIAEYLPITYTTELNTDIGRATRPMCLALKARATLYKASPLFNTTNNKEWWQQAAQANHDLLQQAEQWGIRLGNYSEIWGPYNGDSKETIFAAKRGRLSTWEQYNYPIGVENAQSGMCPTQTLVDAYEYQDSRQTFGERFPGNTIRLYADAPYDNIDPRFEMTIVKNGDIWPNYNLNPIETYQGGLNASPLTNATPTGYYLKKYCDPNVNISTNNPTDSPHAWIIMRLGEFYLNYAEAMYQYYGDADTPGPFTLTANQAINRLRSRDDVNMPHWNGTPADWHQQYQRERMVELAFENHRFWDIRRWKIGQHQKTIKTITLQKTNDGDILITRSEKQRNWNDKYNLFPIPFSEINKNPNLTQNPGW